MEENKLEILDERDGHRLRLRQRIERSGFERLQPHQILEFILYYAIPRQDVNDAAHAILNHFGNLKTVLHATLNELRAVEGIGETTVEWMNLVNRCVAQCEKMNDAQDIFIKNFAQAFQCVARIRRLLPDARLVQLFLDAAGRVVYYEPLEVKNNWADYACIQSSLRRAVLMRPDSMVLMAFMDTIKMPDEQQLERIQNYADALSRSRSGLADVLLADSQRIFSLRQQGMITREKSSLRLDSIREEYMLGMPKADEVTYFQIPRQEEEYEPV